MEKKNVSKYRPLPRSTRDYELSGTDLNLNWHLDPPPRRCLPVLSTFTLTMIHWEVTEKITAVRLVITDDHHPLRRMWPLHSTAA
ncbi:hypothetical protein GN956_G22453 [Arapaima gigas]